jgi:hypothetical protein
MRRVLGATLFVVTLLTAVPAFAQNPNFEVGPVWRVNYYYVKPGQADAFWKDFREHVKPVLEAIKKEGWISEFKTFLNDTTERPGDWNVALAIAYPNYAALDQLDAKAATVAAKHYGSREAMVEAGRKRSELRELVASHVAREVMAK